MNSDRRTHLFHQETRQHVKNACHSEFQLRKLRSEWQGPNVNWQIHGNTVQWTPVARGLNISPVGRTSSGSSLSKQPLTSNTPLKKKQQYPSYNEGAWKMSSQEIWGRSVITATTIYNNWIFMGLDTRVHILSERFFEGKNVLEFAACHTDETV